MTQVKEYVPSFTRKSKKGKIHTVKGFERTPKPKIKKNVHKAYTREVDYYTDSQGRIAYRRFHVPKLRKSMVSDYERSLHL